MCPRLHDFETAQRVPVDIPVRQCILNHLLPIRDVNFHETTAVFRSAGCPPPLSPSAVRGSPRTRTALHLLPGFSQNPPLEAERVKGISRYFKKSPRPPRALPRSLRRSLFSGPKN